MDDRGTEFDITDLADDTLLGPQWDAWLASHPQAAAEVAIARRVRALVAELQRSVAVPAGFEARLLARVREDITVLELLELHLAGMGRALLEMVNLLLSLLPEPQPVAFGSD